MTSLTRCVVIAVAVVLAAPAAWGHSFPEVHTVVIQAERCEVAVLVGFRPASGEATEALLARIGSQPKPHMLDAAKKLLTQQALAPLTFTLDKQPLVPTTVRAKLGLDRGGDKPLVVVLVTFSVAKGGTFQVASKNPRTTRVSWTDYKSGRIDLDQAPAQGRWFSGVASFLLSFAASSGDTACVQSSSSH